ncbi:acyl-CoA thioester hydrolase [Paraburkholderia fungorum]|uniref:Acyl-CoA thioester hydrolase n=1 Tax=Paraburkholderia fungorum TaxID=134537 RepID=A0A1H1JV23_9BURK|nr:thioesterase family protein [Paraburkholderia fungorum]SDR53848.1 acyl-CoA thioester hydrolase [Paraburkholderia fungorum]
MPLPSLELIVESDWIDAYGHMNAACYVAVFDRLGFELLQECGVGLDYTEASGSGIYTVELHTSYHREVLKGDPLRLQLRLLECDEKRLIVLFELFQTRDRYLAATMEQLSIHVDLSTRRVTPFPEPVRGNLERLICEHRNAPEVAKYAKRLNMRRAISS